MPYNYPKISLNQPYTGQQSGGLLSGGGSTLGGLASTAARTGLAVGTGGISEIIAQVLNIVPSIFQGITGQKQLRRAEDIESQYPRPEAEIAPSIEKRTDYLYGKTLARDIPGGEMYRGEIKGATAAGISAASQLGEGSEAYGMLGQLVGREQGAFVDLAKTTAQQVAGYEQSYADSLLAKGEEEKRVWEWDKARPYLSAAQIASQLRESGMQNVSSGMKNIFGSTAEYVSPDFNSSLLLGNENTGSAKSFSMEDVTALIKSLKG